MASFYKYRGRCRCGETFSAPVASSINVRRRPSVRDDIIAGRLHALECRTCGQQITIDAEFSYFDGDRRTLFYVVSRSTNLGADGRKAFHDQVQRAAETASRFASLANCRIVYGMDELRGYLIAQNDSIQYATIDRAKLLIQYDTPREGREPGLRLRLTDVAQDGTLVFQAASSQRESKPRRIAVPNLDMPLGASWANLEIRTLLPALAKSKPDLTQGERAALQALSRYAQKVRQGGYVDMVSDEFLEMINELPLGVALSDDERADLKELFEFAGRYRFYRQQRHLIGIQFGKTLDMY